MRPSWINRAQGLRFEWPILLATTVAFFFSSQLYSQTASSGALTGVAMDPSSAVLPGAVVHLANRDTGETSSAVSDEQGRFNFLLLPPPRYRVEANSAGFETLTGDATVNVTETVHLELRFRIQNETSNINVSAEQTMVRAGDSVLGKDVPLRVPIPGVPAESLVVMGFEGNSRYDGLEVSLTKRFRGGFQLLVSYTFSKTLDTDGSDTNSVSSGNALTLGDQNSPGQRWGRASFDRTHRFVFSSTWDLPGPSRRVLRTVAGNWSLATIATLQSGSALTVASTNAANVFGISEDRGQLSGLCSKSQLVNRGPNEFKLNRYLNPSCFARPLVIGVDGIGTAFGNSGTGIVDGPGQANVDVPFSKSLALSWPTEKSTMNLRAEFYNALNHAQFSNPDTNFSSPTFGSISTTSVNSRVGQLAVKLAF